MAVDPSPPQPPGPGRRPLLMSMAEIAELAGVRRPVVTTWRRRHLDFPSPAGGDAMGPLFSARQVAEWLVSTGRVPPERAGAELSLHALAGLGTGMSPRDLVALVTALICLSHLDGEPLTAGPGAGDLRGELMHRAAQADPHDACLLSEIALLPADPRWLAAAVDDLVEAAWGCREAFERIMGAGPRLAAADLPPHTVSPQLARLMADLSGAVERSRQRTISVCDPAAGQGDLLAAVADAAGPDSELEFQIAETDPYLARLAARRLTVHGVAWDALKLSAGGDLPEGWGDPDVIVTQLPYLPGEHRSPQAVIDRVDDMALRLAPGRTAVVSGPAHILAGDLRPYSHAERTRARLLGSGMVEAIIRLPGGLVPFRPGYEVALWVLTSAYDSPWRGWVLLADVSDRELDAAVTAALAEDVVTWRRDGYRPHAHTRTFGVQVRVSDLVDAMRPLTARTPPPASRKGTAGAGLVSRVWELETALDKLAADAVTQRQPFRSNLASAIRPAPPAQTIGALVKSGRLILRPGTRLRGAQAGLGGHHDVIGVPELLGETRRGQRRIDRVTLAGLPRARLTEPGDVIVTTSPRLAIMVDHDGLAVAGFPARVLRIPASESDSFTPRTLAALLAGTAGGLRPAGAVRPARRLEEYEVPLLSPAEVAFLDQLLTTLDARSARARGELDLLSELREITLAGLLGGKLTFAQTPPGPDGS